MDINLSTGPKGTPPTSEQLTRIKSVIGVKDRSYASGGSLAQLRAMLISEKSCGLALIGDSTAEGQTTKWPDKFLTRLAAEYSAFGVKGYRWNDPTKAWVLEHNVAPPNGERYWGSTVDQAEVYTVALGPGDFQIPRNQDMAVEIKMEVADWSKVDSYIVAMFEGSTGTDADRIFMLSVSHLKEIIFAWYNSSGTYVDSYCGTGFSYGVNTPFWLRIELDTDNGAGGRTVTYKHRATDGAAWTTLTAATVAGASSLRTLPLNNPGTYLRLFLNGAGQLGRGTKVYQVLVYDQLDPTVGALPIAPIDHFDRGATTNMAILGGSPVITVRNAAMSGWGMIDYIPGNARYYPYNKIFHKTNEGICAGLVALGHNSDAAIAFADMGSFAIGYSDILDYIAARFIDMQRIYVAQNPQYGTGERAQRHGLRMAKIMGQSKRENAGLLNLWQTFHDDPRGLAALMGDSLHPNDAGYELCAQVLWNAFESRAL